MKIDIDTLMLPPDKLLTRLERAGFYTVGSELSRVGYVIKDKNIIVLAGKSGTLAIELNNLDDFINELIEVSKMAKFRQLAQVKGA